MDKSRIASFRHLIARLLALAMLPAYADSLSVTGLVTAIIEEHPHKNYLVLDTGHALQTIAVYDKATPHPGDRVAVTGKLNTTDLHVLSVSAFSVLGHEMPPAPRPATPAEITSGKCDLQAVSLEGTVVDAFVDEIDNRWYYLVLRAGGSDVYLTLPGTKARQDEVIRLVDARIRVTGVALLNSGRRQLLGSVVFVRTFKDFQVLVPPPPDPFDQPELVKEDFLRPQDLRGLGRRRVTGDVLAVWNANRLLLRRTDGNVLAVELVPGESTPSCGDRIVAVGLVETDFFRLNLASARCRTLLKNAMPPAAAVSVHPDDILTDKNGKPRVWTEYYGRAIRLEGFVRSLPNAGTGRFYLACEEFLVPIDISAHPNIAKRLALGARIAVSGVCLLEAGNWRPGAPFPHIHGFVTLVRTSDDIILLSSAPWWTPGRFLTVLALLLGLIVFFLVWNRLLQRTVERRSRQLFKSQIAKVSSDLRVEERTRLAVELHDSVAQMLSAVSMQLDASIWTRSENPCAADVCLETAQRMLKSGLAELRRCLWDLRNDALDEPDFQNAVGKTLAPVLGDARLILRLQIKRTRLRDATAHAILRIIRELVTNGIRHGRAKTIRIAGAMDNGHLLISVRDDGCGFDPATALGPANGHFGLDGIRERLRPLGGKLEIESAVGRGTHAKIILESPW